MTLIAKPVIDKQFWILQDGNQKVGNIEACAGGYQVKIHNQVAQFKTIRMAAQRIDIQFEVAVKTTKIKPTSSSVYGFPVASKAHNAVWDVKMKLPVYTKTPKSKSWFAAGWYVIKKGKSNGVIQNPKIIMLQRYPYMGPYLNEDLANDHAHTKIC